MSAEEQSAKGMDWLGQTDAGANANNSAEVDQRFPWAMVHNDKDGKGRNGGLFIQTDVAPSDLIVSDLFREAELEFEDSNSNTFEKKTGFISSGYSLAIIACDHDAQGRPRAYKEYRKNRIKPNWCFTVICAVIDAFSEETPFKINFRGTSAIRMANHISNFDRFVVGTVTREKRKANKAALAASRHQFSLPVGHAPEKVGEGTDSSWACPVQELIPETVKETRTPKYSRTGTSVLEVYAKDPRTIFDLFLGADAEGQARVEKFSEWVDQYGQYVKIVGVGGEVIGGNIDKPVEGNTAGANDEEQSHFTHSTDEKYLPTGPQNEFFDKLVEACDLGPEQVEEELAFVVGFGSLQPEENIVSALENLTRRGMSIFIDHLKEKEKEKKAEKKQTGAAFRRPNRGAFSQAPADVADDTPFR